MTADIEQPVPAGLATTLLRLMQDRIGWRQREAVARVMARIAARRFDGRFNGASDPARLAQIREQGICRAPLAIAPEVCREARAYFEATRCYSAHVPAQSDGIPRSIEETRRFSNYGSYKLEQSMLAPRVLELALDPALLDLAGAYLGCAPLLYTINTFWTFPVSNPGLTHNYHRDQDDYRFVVVFIYWTDVDVGEGEFYFIEGTHDYGAVDGRMRRTDAAPSAETLRRLDSGNGYGYDGLYERLFEGDIRCFTGKAGTAIMTDTFGLHRGALPGSRPRLCTWLRYGLYANEVYRKDRTRPTPVSLVRGRIADDPVTRHVTRLVLDWDR